MLENRIYNLGIRHKNLNLTLYIRQLWQIKGLENIKLRKIIKHLDQVFI